MTKYAGEQFRIITTATTYAGATLLTPADVQSVTVTILNRDRTLLIDEAVMDWNVDEELWEYKWVTAGQDPGTYHYRITVTGVDGEPSVEWRRVRLSKPTAIAPTV